MTLVDNPYRVKQGEYILHVRTPRQDCQNRACPTIPPVGD